MFDKEAKEFVHKKYPDDTLNHAVFSLCTEKAYIAGAEFGYNKGYNKGYHNAEEHYMNVIDSQHKLVEESKANEWHYVKDGDLPKGGVKVLSEKGELVIYKDDCFCWFEHSPNADNIKLRKWEEPIAWKEIILPELPKEIRESNGTGKEQVEQ